MSKIKINQTKEPANSVFYLVSNENGMHDRIPIEGGEGERLFYFYPSIIEGYSFAFKQDLTLLSKSNSSIESIYPLYPFVTGKISLEEKSLPITLQKDDKEKEIDIFSSRYSVHRIDYMPYMNHENFLVDHQVFKEYDSDSGIYISQRLYFSLFLWTARHNVSVTARVSLPASTSIVNEDFYGVNLDLRDNTQYTHLEYTFDIAGVIVDDQSNNIYIPYSLSEKLYHTFSQTNISLMDNEDIWEPNAWIVECNQSIGMDDFAAELDDDLDNFVLATYDDETNRKLYE